MTPEILKQIQALAQPDITRPDQICCGVEYDAALRERSIIKDLTGSTTTSFVGIPVVTNSIIPADMCVVFNDQKQILAIMWLSGKMVTFDEPVSLSAWPEWEYSL